jgi:hypothetical protein
VLGAACDGGSGAVAPTAAPACDEGRARSVVEGFLAAYGGGEAGLTDRFFAGPDRFEWSSDDPGRVTSAATDPVSDPYDRSTLDRFLAERRGGGDRMTLASLTGFTVRAGTASFALTVHRPSGVSAGKAALDCRTQLLVLVSLGRPSA